MRSNLYVLSGEAGLPGEPGFSAWPLTGFRKTGAKLRPCLALAGQGFPHPIMAALAQVQRVHGQEVLQTDRIFSLPVVLIEYFDIS